MAEGSLTRILNSTAERGTGKAGPSSATDPLSIFSGLEQELAGTLMQGMPIPQQSISERIQDAISKAGAAILPTSGFVYGEDELPPWFPKALRPIVESNPAILRQVFDPYMGERARPGDERVFMGEVRRKPKTPKGGMAPEGMTPAEARAAGLDHNDFPKKRKRDKTLNFQQALNLPYEWEDDEIIDAMKRFRRAGVNVTTFDQLTSEWGRLVERASMTYSLSRGQRKLTPWDVLELRKKESKAAGTLTDFESGTQTRVATSVSEIPEAASWATLQQTLSQLLGRDPSDQEVRDYAYRMNTLAAQNPSITETITRYKGGEAVSSESSTTGGFGADDMAREAYEGAQDDPEYARVQGGTTYYNALLSAIGEVGNV